MVWFQCEDCGENLKKPKLANHFHMCSAHKLSCIDCGQMFDQQSVQSHTQRNTVQKVKEMYHIMDKLSPISLRKIQMLIFMLVYLHMLLGFAASAIHRLLANRLCCSMRMARNTEQKLELSMLLRNNLIKQKKLPARRMLVAMFKRWSLLKQMVLITKCKKFIFRKTLICQSPEVKRRTRQKKRKVEASENGLSKKSEEKNASDLTIGEVIQAEKSEASQRKSKKKKGADESFNCKDQADKRGTVVEASHSKPKWKKIITSTLKSSDGVMKIKKLQKLVLEALKESSGMIEDEEKLRDKLMHKINSSTRFTIESKHIRLVAKTEES